MVGGPHILNERRKGLNIKLTVSTSTYCYSFILLSCLFSFYESLLTHRVSPTSPLKYFPISSFTLTFSVNPNLVLPGIFGVVYEISQSEISFLLSCIHYDMIFVRHQSDINDISTIQYYDILNDTIYWAILLGPLFRETPGSYPLSPELK